MDLGFETIGNATLVCHDRVPTLVTDPWLDGDAYFGSWGLSHEVPPAQVDAIERAPFVWISHGHPDHLHMRSLQRLRHATVLVPDHVGGRIAEALRADGFRVEVLPDRRWVPLSDRIRVRCFADYNQDAVLLVELGGRCLVVDVNDATDHGWRGAVRREVADHEVAFLLQLFGFGDADMINVFDEDGTRLPLPAAREPLGATIASRAESLGVRYVIPFSSMHRYRRADSAWANEHVVDLDDYRDGFASQRAELLPAFVRYDVLADAVETIDPRRRDTELVDPAELGDDWTEPLEPADVDLARRYFRSIRHVADHFDFVAVDVGGEEHVIGLDGGRRRPGLTFAAPRRSLVTSLEHRVFDDMLIGNFMRTTVHRGAPGGAGPAALYPHFTPYVGKYADNGGARTPEELRRYFRAYRDRAPVDFLRHRVEQASVDLVRRHVAPDSRPYRLARRAYRRAVTARG